MRPRGKGRARPARLQKTPVTIEQVTISSVGHRGDGVAETASGRVYVPFALPNERLKISRRGERGAIAEIIEPSPERVEPVCRHFTRCGGCRLQHWRQDAYLGWMREQVVAALAARGLECAVGEVHAPAPGTRRRAVLAARFAGGRLLVGYHAPASHDLVAISECPVLTPALENALAPVTRLIAAAPPFRGEAKIMLLETGAGIDIAVEGGEAPSRPDALAALADIAREAGFARVTWNGEWLIRRAAPLIDFGGVAVEPPPGGFLQAVGEAEEMMSRLVLDGVGDAAAIADLFAGCGTFSLKMARTARVTAVEGDRAALAALEKASHMPGLKGVTCLARDLYEEPLGPDELSAFDAVVLDPPFAGARAQAEALAASAVPRIVMVSCNPATFARDARSLVDGGYRLRKVTPVDQFVFSPHIELVGHFER